MDRNDIYCRLEILSNILIITESGDFYIVLLFISIHCVHFFIVIIENR